MSDEKFHHPHVDRLREATQDNPAAQARQFGRTIQQRLHRKVMRATRATRTVDPGWAGGDPPEAPEQPLT
jgi:hypothetical protein